MHDKVIDTFSEIYPCINQYFSTELNISQFSICARIMFLLFVNTRFKCFQSNIIEANYYYLFIYFASCVGKNFLTLYYKVVAVV